MKVYFVNCHCTSISPADLTLPCGLSIKEGDICIRSIDDTLYALFVINPRTKWKNLPLISSCFNSQAISWGNSMLNSFNGIGERYGNLERLGLLRMCFSDKKFHDFLTEIIAILKYEKDLIDLAVLKALIESVKITPNKSLCHAPSTAATQYPKEIVSFFSCLPGGLQNELTQKLKRDTPQYVLHHLRTEYPKEFRIAFKKFNEKNPGGNIYDGLP